jgi:hypothetical protein
MAFLIALAVFGTALHVIRPQANGDEPHYVVMAISIASDQDLDLADEYDDPATMQEVYGVNSLGPQADRYPGGHGFVSIHPPGLPLLLAPVAAVTHDAFWMRLEIVIIGAIGAALLMALLARLPIRDERARWLAWAAIVLSAPIVVYSTALYPEVPGITVLLGAVVLLSRREVTPWQLAGASLLAAFLPWLNVRFAAFTLVLAAVMVWRAWHARRRALALTASLAPLVASALLFAGAYDYWYGSPWPDAPYALSTSKRNWLGLYRFGVGGLLSAQYGWLPNAPVQLCGVVAIGLLVRRLPLPALAGVAAAVLYLVVIATSGVGFPGSSFAGRLWVILMPLSAFPLLVLLATQRRWWAWGPFAALGLLTLALTGQALADAANPATGSARARYDRLWPNFDPLHMDAPQAWAPTAAELQHPTARLVAGGAPTQEDNGILVAPRGRAGVIAAGTTQSLSPSAVQTGILLRAGEPATGVLAVIEVRDRDHALLEAHPVLARALPPQTGWRSIQLVVDTAQAGPLTYTVRTTGRATLWASAPRIGTMPSATWLGSSGARDVGKTLAWIAALVAVGVALVALDRRSPRERWTVSP